MDVSREGERKEKIFTLPFIGIMLADLCVRLCNYMQMALLPLYIIERGFPKTVGGIMVTTFMLSSLLLRPVSGRLADKKGRYAASLLGAGIYCAATGMYFLAAPLALLIVMRVLQGAGFSFDGTGVYALATDHIPESRLAEGIGYLGLGQPVATALSPLIALAIKNQFGYRTAFMVVFSLSALVVALLMLLRFAERNIAKPKELIEEKRLPASDSTARGASLLSRLVDKSALKPSFLILLITLAGHTISTYLIPYADSAGIANPGIFFTVQAVMVFTARLVMGKIRNRFGATAILVSGMLLIFMSLIGLALRLSQPLLITCGALYGLGIGVVQPQLAALAIMAAGKENRGMANSTYFMMMDIGTAMSGVIFGAVADVAGYVSIYAIASAIVICTLLLFRMMRRKGFSV